MFESATFGIEKIKSPMPALISFAGSAPLSTRINSAFNAPCSSGEPPKQSLRDRTLNISIRSAFCKNQYWRQILASFSSPGYQWDFAEAVAVPWPVLNASPQPEVAEKLTGLLQYLIGDTVNPGFEVKNLNSEPVAADKKE